MQDVPVNKSPKKPTKKKTFSLSDFKKKTNTSNVPDKELKWLKCSNALQKATGLPGFPVGYVALSRGFTNTGKSTSISEAIVDAQKQGILPIIIDTENNIGRKRLEIMGFDWGNDDDGFYIMIDNEYLLQNFGKKQDSKRNEAAIEDLSACINHFLDLQEAGELPYDLLFAIDSLGTVDCIRTINAQEKNTSDNNQWNAGAFEKTFKYLINNRIPNSRKVDKEYTNTIIAVQKIWLDSMSGGMPTVKHKGGEAFAFGARLIYHHGGIMTHGTRKVSAVSKKKEVVYGIETKVSVFKNQIDGPLGGISLEGKLVSTPHGFVGAEKEDKDDYKKENILYFRDVLGDENLNAEDISTQYSADDSNISYDVDEFNDKIMEG